MLNEWLKRYFVFLILSFIPIYLTCLYIDNYGKNIPTNDQWLDSINIAVAANDGSLTLSDITRVYYGHRAVFTNAFTAFLGATTDWQVKYELYLSLVLAIGRFVLVVLIFRAICSEQTPLVLLPFSLLIFSAYQYLVWLSGIYSVWHFVSFFSLATVWVLVQFQVSWRSLIVAAVLAACASFSQGSGVVTFPILTITLWMFGYRHWKYIAFWLLAMALTLGLYFYNSDIGMGGETSDTAANITLKDPAMLVKFVFAFLGNPFTYHLDTELPIYVGVIGVLLLVGNITYLWFQGKIWKYIAPWLTLAGYASSIAVTVYLTRYREDRFVYAIEQRYALVSTNFWIAFVGTLVLAIWYFQREENPRSWKQILLTANIVFAFVLVILYFQANLWNAQATAFRYQYTIGEAFPPQESCILNFPLHRDFACLENSVPLGDASEDDIYRLAYYELALFKNQQQIIDILPENYRAGSPIILDSPSRWMNAYLRRWYLPRANEENLFHIAPEAVEISTDTLQEPLAPVVIGYNEDIVHLLEDFLGEAETVWYIRTRETQVNEPDAYEILTQLGYLPTVIPSGDFRYNTELFVTRYERKPDQFAEVDRFGEFLSLQNVTLSEENFAACQMVTVKSWWRSATVPTTNFALHLQLLDSDKNIVVETVSGLTPVPTVLWSPEQSYLDERALVLPCDLPEADYSLRLAVRNPDTGEFLPDQRGIIAEFSLASD